jgi:DNA-3-methyladenine glycosylase II
MTDPLLIGLKRVARRDRDIRRALKSAGTPPIRRIEPGFSGLLRILVGQQVSAAAASAIWAKVMNSIPDLSPRAVLARPESALRDLGLSRPKVRYAKSLARSIVDGDLDLDGLSRVGNDAAASRLTQVTGIGQWTAQVYLLFALGRGDAWPGQDLALIVACQRIKGLDARPSPGEMEALAEPWRPWRGAVAHLLWHVYKQPL